MSDANQVRINELARELEVKAKAIIDLLPGFGVTEKKTHSSSIPEDVAEKVKDHLKGVADAETAAEADRSAKEAAAKAALRRPPAPAAPPVAPAHPPVAAKPAAPAPTTAPPAPAPVAVKPAPAAPPPGATPAPVAPVAKPAAPAPAVTTPPAAPAAERPAAPATPPTSGAPRPAPQQPLRPTHPTTRVPGQQPGTRPGGTPPSQSRPQQPGTQPQTARSGAPASAPRPQQPLRPMPTGNRGPVPGTAPGDRDRRPSGPRPGQPMRPQQSGGQGGRTFTPRPSGPGGPGGPGGSGRTFSQRPGAAPSGARPGPRTPGARPGMLPSPFSEKPSKAEPGKPLYARKPQQRQRPMADKREMEGERKLHPTRQRPGAGGRGVAAAAIAPPEPRAPRDITLTEGITIRELAEKLDVRAKDLLKTLLDRGVFASINQALDVQTATDLAQSFNGVVSVVSLEEEMVLEVAKEETKENLKPRPPVVTVMGHVDHGKTSLLDGIRLADVAAGEAGGITQHIGAYKVQVGEKSVVFVDTPGHEAFTRMRARGAKVTDIVVLVVAADDGVMPQTREAIDHARAAKVPIIVAINKIDKPEAQLERVKRQLTENSLMPAEWGGDTEFVEVSAKKKTGIEKLLETILLVADLRELKANPDAPATGTVLESRVDKGRGPVATILVQNGTLKSGDFFICGSVFGKVRAMFDDRGRVVNDAPPSTPVEVLGLQGVPDAGDLFQVTDEAKARHIVEYRQGKQRDAAMARISGSRITLDQLHEQLKA